MAENPTLQALEELLPYFEALETQTTAVFLLLKQKKIVTDKQLSAALEQSGKAASVKWFAARTRMARLLASPESDTKSAEPKPQSPPEPTAAKKDSSEVRENSAKPAQKEEKQREDDASNENQKAGSKKAQSGSREMQKETQDKRPSKQPVDPGGGKPKPGPGDGKNAAED